MNPKRHWTAAKWQPQHLLRSKCASDAVVLIVLPVRLAWLAGALSLRSSAKVPSDHLSSLWTWGCLLPKVHIMRVSRILTSTLSTRSQKRKSTYQHRGITRTCSKHLVGEKVLTCIAAAIKLRKPGPVATGPRVFARAGPLHSRTCQLCSTAAPAACQGCTCKWVMIGCTAGDTSLHKQQPAPMVVAQLTAYRAAEQPDKPASPKSAAGCPTATLTLCLLQHLPSLAAG